MNKLILLSIALGVLLALATVLFFYLIKFVDKDEELVIEGLTAQTIVHGPKAAFLPIFRKSIEIRKATTLKSNEYARLVDERTGEVRVVRGQRGCLVPGPYEKYIDGDKMQAVDLRVYEYVKIQDKRTGAVRTECGEQLVFLGPVNIIGHCLPLPYLRVVL